jgi:threonine-phosphate decarboxylase
MAADFPVRAVHGGSGKLQQEKTHKKVLDFSASVNPLPPRFTWHCDPEKLVLYPDDSYTQLKGAIARAFNRHTDEICVGNGSIELIRAFCSVTLKGDRKYFFEQPTFGEYDLSARLAGATCANQLNEADVCFVCNPNNPTGTIRSQTEMKNFLNIMASNNGILFADEAFIELSDPSVTLSDVKDPNLFVLHSLTKSFSVPGIRFGYGFGDPGLIEKIETSRAPWSVNAFAEAFAMEAFTHFKDLALSRKLIVKERDWLDSQLKSMGLNPKPSQANFLLIECGKNVTLICDRLMNESILVRDCTSFGLPSCIRIAVRTREENRILIEALVRCMR